MKKIIILEGGNNEEHKVSLESSKEVKKVLIKKKIEYQSIIVNPKTFKNKINKLSNKHIFFCLCMIFFLRTNLWLRTNLGKTQNSSLKIKNSFLKLKIRP